MDREGADLSAVLKQTRALLTKSAAEWADDESLMAALADEDETAMGRLTSLGHDLSAAKAD